MNIDIVKNQPLSEISSIKTGGIAKEYVLVNEPENVVEAIEYAKENKMKFKVIGNATNILFSDNGFDGLIIQFSDAYGPQQFDHFVNYFIAITDANQSVINFLTSFAEEENIFETDISPYEKLYGIPGTIGGALYMNAEAGGVAISDNVIFIEVFDTDTMEKKYLLKEECKFSYRHSIFQEKPNYIILSADFVFKKAPLNSEDPTKLCSENMKKRFQSQPLDYPSLGSFFRRPIPKDGQTFYAGKLIEDAGLKGYKIGGAEVSDKHAGFIINTGNASTSDILKLKDYIIEKVKENSGIVLEPEVILPENL